MFEFLSYSVHFIPVLDKGNYHIYNKQVVEIVFKGGDPLSLYESGLRTVCFLSMDHVLFFMHFGQRFTTIYLTFKCPASRFSETTQLPNLHGRNFSTLKESAQISLFTAG